MKYIFFFMTLVLFNNISYAFTDYSENINRLENMEDFSSSEILQNIKKLYRKLEEIDSEEEKRKIDFQIDYSWIEYYKEKNSKY